MNYSLSYDGVVLFTGTLAAAFLYVQAHRDLDLTLAPEGLVLGDE